MARSWTLPSPVLFTASNPNAADGKAGVATILTIIDPTADRPDWQAKTGPRGIVYQAEGEDQAAEALAKIKQDGAGFEKAVVTTLGIDPAPFIQLGATSCMVECYAQADVIHTSIPRMRWQARHEGWPHVIPVLGVYDAINLQHYIDFAGAGPDIPGNGGRPAFKAGHWKGGPLAIYLAEGMTDTASWPTLAAL